MIKKLSYFTYESLPVYTMVSSLVLDGNVIQFYLINPTYAKSESNHVMQFSKYSKAKYALQMRLSVEIENSDDVIKIKRWSNFGFTYDELSQLLYLDLLPKQQFALEKKDKQIFAKLQEEYIKIVFIENIQKDEKLTFLLLPDQYKLMSKQIQESLTWIAGWHSPHQFVKSIEIPPPNDNN